MEKCSILIIDDDLDDVEILTDAFKKSGVEGVHTVHTAMQAFMYLEGVKEDTNLPKLMVTDLYLPGIRGDEFLLDLKAMPRYKDIPVIVLSTTKSEQEVERYRQMGALDYLVKPSTYDQYFEVAKNISGRVTK